MLGATIGYQVATYSGEQWVCYDDPEIENEVLCAKARLLLYRSTGALPFGYRNFWVIERDVPC